MRPPLEKRVDRLLAAYRKLGRRLGERRINVAIAIPPSMRASWAPTQ
jgi:hypothetical protein